MLKNVTLFHLWDYFRQSRFGVAVMTQLSSSWEPGRCWFRLHAGTWGTSAWARKGVKGNWPESRSFPAFLCPLHSVGPLSKWMCSWERQDYQNVPFLWQASCSDGFLWFIQVPSPSHQRCCCVPPCWHMLMLCCILHGDISKQLCPHSCVCCWKSTMTASYWWK